MPKRGSGPGRLKGLCPFHQEDTPSFSVDINKGLFYCFGCTTGGDVFKFVMRNRKQYSIVFVTGQTVKNIQS